MIYVGLEMLIFYFGIVSAKLDVNCVDVFSCRHAAIAKYFGDPPPLCNNSCDFCQNPAAVKRLSADAKIGTAPSSNPKRHRVSRLILCAVLFLVFSFFFVNCWYKMNKLIQLPVLSADTCKYRLLHVFIVTDT